MMKISALLSLLLVCALPNPAEPVVCALFKDTLTQDEFKCRNRPDINVLDFGGPGCHVSCVSRNSTCAELGNDGEVCGKVRVRIGIYALGKVVYQFCLLPEGLLARRFKRYCFTLRVCLARQGPCGCRVVANGRPCLCHIREDVNGDPEFDTRCPFIDEAPTNTSQSFLTALLPSEYEIESEISAQMTDAEVANHLDEAYLMFLDYMASLK